MAAKAIFRLNSFTTEMHSGFPHQGADGRTDYSKPERTEKRTLNMTPVTPSESDPEELKAEVRKFWDASPSGSLQLGVVNQDAWHEFRHLEGLYEVTFRYIGGGHEIEK